jgi:hypothetical protein
MAIPLEELHRPARNLTMGTYSYSTKLNYEIRIYRMLYYAYLTIRSVMSMCDAPSTNVVIDHLAMYDNNGVH